jgi:NADH-quinone oxidoreductase chain I
MNKIKKLLKTIFLIEIAQGMWLTLKTMLTRQKSHAVNVRTRQYPNVKRKPYPGSRGLHAMWRDEKGKEACIGCGLCEAVCPAEAIVVITTEGPEHEKVVSTYQLDLFRCIFCGYCVDACPVSAIDMTPEFELSCYTREEGFYSKERLMKVGDCYAGGKAVKKQ